MEKVKFNDKQSFPDLAIQLYGDISLAFEMAEENRMSVTDTIEPGTEVIYNPNWITDFQLVNNLRKTSAILISDDNAEDIFSPVFADTFI